MLQTIFKDIRVLELAGLAPSPFTGQVLADFGADVVRIDRVGGASQQGVPGALHRGKRSVSLNLKDAFHRECFTHLVASADVILEPFRAGVMEKLGLGPDTLLKQNPRLIYARLTGFGQSGSLSKVAGHDINYLAISGVLSKLGRHNEKPHWPGNILADFAAGGLMCAFGISAALFERSRSNKGQVVDCSMIEGSAYLSTFLHQAGRAGIWSAPRGTNLLDGGAPFYDTYECSEPNTYIAVGCIEPQFYAQFVQKLLDFVKDKQDRECIEQTHQMDMEKWPQLASIFTKVIATRTKEAWTNTFDSIDACVSPVLEFDEMPTHPYAKHLVEKTHKASSSYDPKPAPQFSRTPALPISSRKVANPGEHTKEVFKEWSKLSNEMIEKLIQPKSKL